MTEADYATTDLPWLGFQPAGTQQVFLALRLGTAGKQNFLMCGWESFISAHFYPYSRM